MRVLDRPPPVRAAHLRMRLAAGLVACAWPALFAASAWAQASPAASTAPRAVEDPHYGAVLFDFFQDQSFDALGSLMVSQRFERLAHHADEAEVLRGGLLLSYGLHREAGAIFERLLASGAPPATRDRAWYHLAKLRHQRGLDVEARHAIEQIAGRLPGELDDERVLLHAQILLALDDAAGAAKRLEPLAQDSPAARYARYNLGVALIRGGDTARGGAMLDALGRAPAENEEYRALRDKVNVALGYAALREGRAADARSALQRVRLQGAQSTRALLGFGWAALALGEPRQALVPWTELLGREAGDAAVLEARLAVPHAQAELGARGQALASYESALAAYADEDRRLDESIAAIRGGQLVEGLLARNPDDADTRRGIETLPPLPHAHHLTAVLAEHGFQQAWRNLRDLRFLAERLAAWQEKLGLYREMLDTRRTAYAERLPRVLERSRSLGLAPLQQQRDALADSLARATASADGLAFADARERAAIERLDRVQLALAARAGDPAFDAERERARRVEGALAWSLAQAHPARLWAARKALAATDQALDTGRAHEAALTRAQREEPARFDALDARLRALGPQLDRAAPQAQALALEQARALQEIAVAALEAQKIRLDGYVAQASLAVAQLVDRAARDEAGSSQVSLSPAARAAHSTLSGTADHAQP